MKKLIFILLVGLASFQGSAQVQLTSIKKTETKFTFPIGQRILAGQTGYFLEYGSFGALMDSLGILYGGNVKGSGTATRVAFWASEDSLASNENLYWDNVNHYLGIGTTIPTKALTVTSDALINTITAGLGPGNQSFNVVFGSGALANNTTGNYNVAFGSGALAANVSNNSNIAIGAGALINSTADDNVAIGRNALTSNTTGTSNFGLGGYSLASNTTGQQNVFTGALSGQNITTGSYNVGYGTQTLRNGAAKNYNCAVGYFALANSNGNNNVAFGAFSCSSITTGVNNTAVGYAAGAGAITSDFGIFMGHRAGIYETGSYKLLISSITPSNEADARTKAIIYGVQSATTSSQILDLNAKVKPTYKPGTSTSLAGYDSGGYLSDVTLGTGLNITGGTLNATGGPDSTIVSDGWGIDVTESPLNTFTVSADTSQMATQHDISDLVREARTISTTAPLQGGGDLSTNRTFSITQATTSTDGYITATDWNLFNAKPTGSGSAGRVAWWSATSDLTSDINLFWDTTNDRLGIGTTSPSANLHVTGNVRIEGGSGTPVSIMGRNSIGLINNLALGTGFSITSGILNFTETGNGTVTSISTTNGITGGTITTTGTIQLTGQAAALHNFTGTGIMVRTGSATFSARTLTAGTGISITNGDGISGNPVINVSNPLPAGSSSQTLAYLSGTWTASSFLKTNSSSTTSGNSKRVTINDDIGGESWPLFYHTATKFLVNGRVQMNSTASTAVTSIMGRNDNQEVGNAGIGANMNLTSGILSQTQVLGVLARNSGSASFSTTSTPTKLDFNTTLGSVNTTLNTSTDEIFTNITGYGAYEIDCDCQFNPGATATYNFGIYVNGSLNGALVKQIPMLSGTTTDINIKGYVTSLGTADEIDIRVSTGSGTSGNTIGRCLLALKGL